MIIRNDTTQAGMQAARQALLNQRADLALEILSLRERLSQAAQGMPEATSGGSASAALGAEEDDCVSRLQHAQAELEAVLAALQRQDDGCWGECTLCGEAIAAARLQAMPSAALCLACQQDIERRGQRPA